MIKVAITIDPVILQNAFAPSKWSLGLLVSILNIIRIK